MKKLILIFSLLFTLLSAQAVRKVEANPINVEVMLTEQADSAGIASTCEYYGYERQLSQDGYDVYQHPNGSIIRYTFTTTEDGKDYLTIEVKAKGTLKDKDEILKGLNFQKNGSSYERKSIGHLTRCSSSSQGFLRFSNQPKVIK